MSLAYLAFQQNKMQKGKKALQQNIQVRYIYSGTFEILFLDVQAREDPPKEIWCQFHQHFTWAFFIPLSFAQLFSSYSLAL